MYETHEMTEPHRAVWEWLVAHHAGAANAAPHADILARYNLFHVETLTDRRFRQLCSELVEYFHCAVCTLSDSGYYIARTPEELAHGVRDLESRAVAILERARALKDARPLEPQGRLFD